MKFKIKWLPLLWINLFALLLINFFDKSKLTPANKFDITASDNKSIGTKDGLQWPVSNLDWATSPVDLSFLNLTEKPAGRRGFVKSVGESLIFEDGTIARFWGTNLTAYTLFGTSKDNVKRQAKRISALGFNLVRIHHFDSPWVNPNIFGKDAKNTRHLDSSSLEKLDWWITCLKEEGIFVWLDLEVQRNFTKEDHIFGFDEIKGQNETVGLKGYNYVNQDMQQAMKDFNKAYLTHYNVYTKRRYIDEPAIISMLITNENDITHHFGNSLLPNKKVPLHNNIYMKMANDFALNYNLPRAKIWHSWEPGPSKLFLNDLEHRFNLDMMSHLRELGVKVPITASSIWGEAPIYSLPSLTTGDIIDVHAYGGEMELKKNPLLKGNIANWLSMGQVAGKPMSVSEWNVSPFPVPDRHTSPLYIASSAGLQGWDAVMLYAYAQVPLNDAGKPSNWHAYNDPAMIATLPAAALLYRQGHVKEAITTYTLIPDKSQLFYESITPDSSIAARTASEKGKLVIVMPNTIELPWLKNVPAPKNSNVIRDLNQSLLEKSATEVVSDTGELKRNWVKGVYTINTTRTQAAVGDIGNEIIQLKDVELKIRTIGASVAVQSLDNSPINSSNYLMISLGAQAMPTENFLPFRTEPVTGQIKIHAKNGLKLYKGNSIKNRVEIPVQYSHGNYIINLDSSLETSWLFLK